MVCLTNEGTVAMAIIRDTICAAGIKKNGSIALTPLTLVSTIFETVENDFHYTASSVELVIQNTTGSTVILNQHQNKTLGEIGVVFEQGIRNVILINTAPKSMTLLVSDALDDDLILGASASPTTAETPSSSTDPPLSIEYTCTLMEYKKQSMHDGCNYIGLVNQAMTCYLNSLLQALFMTPEFRNALYNWEFKGSQEEKSIPYQLQRLFLNLQTSSKSAVETTELTRSFGWDLSEAWQQHDIQELCRVMFDALEHKFKETQQANFINDLYQGKMLDYVKCLECGTDNSREDTFLDIPLPVRPFGSTTAYNSVEEALRAFVQPETLEGNNQYHCDKCKKKCDAHKGFKFIKFPYVLTLHLKRFDFDYSTMHRIKLNDKVVFPELLNLNSLVTHGNGIADNESNEERETVVKCDDCSTTDSGSALDDENCQFNDIASTAGHYDTCQDDDEGIDVSIGSHHHENEKNHQQDAKGPYKYELFSIMIHSGSASGGHYYAYIKDFQKNHWFCFNDQTVNRITEEDIRKTYGGGPTRAYYSNAYSSSTNAYMLMYRQIDKDRNCSVMQVEEFPAHIKTLLNEIRDREENERALREHDRDMIKLVVYLWHPLQNQRIDKKIYVRQDTTIQEATEKAYERFQLNEIVALADCRLVTYNKDQDCVGCSFEESNVTFCDISIETGNICIDWQLQIKQPGTEFLMYKIGGVNMKLFFINLNTEEVEGPNNFYVNMDDTVFDIKCRIAKMLRMDCNTIKLVQESYNTDLQYLDDDDGLVMFDSNHRSYKLYAAEAIDDDSNKPFCKTKLNKVIDCFMHVVAIEVYLPEIDINTLENLSIPPLDMNQNVDKNDLASGDRLRISPQPGTTSEGFGDQSNSEDSSLSESDRTLVGDAPGDSAALSSSSNSPADQHMASPSDPTEDPYDHDVFGHPGEEMNWDDDTNDVPQRLPNYYFRVVSRLPNYIDDSSNSCVLIQVDKRISLVKFKKNLEPIVGVPVEYFKIFKQNSSETEWAKPHESLLWAKDNEKLLVKLGRVLKHGEYSGKVFFLTLENTDVFKYLFDWVIAKGQTVGQVKKDILSAAKKRHLLDIPFNKSRLRTKDWKVPAKVYLDDQKFCEDVTIGSNWEMFLQDLGDGEKVTNINQLCLFVKRWCPSTLTLTAFQEVVLNLKTVDELKNKLSEVSGIPQEYVEVALLKKIFPSDMNILEIQDLDWNPNVSLLESWPLQVDVDGKIFLYRDSREKLKEITPEERKEIDTREGKRLGKRIPKATYGNRKERALKIYLDSSPKKSEGPCVD